MRITMFVRAYRPQATAVALGGNTVNLGGWGKVDFSRARAFSGVSDIRRWGGWFFQRFLTPLHARSQYITGKPLEVDSCFYV